MAINYIYKIDKGYEKNVLAKHFQSGKLRSTTLIGDAAGAMSAKEYVVKSKPRAKILEFKKGTYIKSEAEIRDTNIQRVKSVRD